ncbi:hypothetical protein D8B26_008162 [Coccidioides posadasii str. Silveira]|uniref:Lysosomal cystine transporter n=3 Tax=Coccidioides posadasii TaxID=199306 RepID=E9DDR2_COCPS|nr:cystinosin, putative [Coccidioides posadasii C735 delta SOWgp]EER29363.1 cystinosin, putative [Coccidioides posadasii C735 delta SOWgp]EFW15266.1 lysosomal cystine transporter [Coccidioides posadasii str. Silveira]KMM70303.1 CTNS protein [Coccidioides posadasii RMSCC 3488]QVM13554.1 hypothetical protein D8B26_008162 [Coccidioides posadasii str. Silveira]|eukprot:XP_003071508.1 cystinosin, putative [Coccidioides posadasii C735 delta SOWgp]
MASQGEVFARAVSRLIGWIYMFCWSASFYPQPILNWRRRSTHGLAIDFPTTNVLGFLCYAIYTTAFLYSPLIREQYAARHPRSPEPSVRFNDFAFAMHAIILSVTVYSQFFPKIWGFRVSKFQRVSRTVAGIFWGCICATAIITVWVASKGGYDPSGWAWIDVIYTVSYVKLVVTVIKYIPQAWVNYKRKSTVGWSIGQILLDFSGGVLSILQLIIDSALEDDWSGITGNPIKLLLGNVSIFFDLIFMAQHYIIYPDRRISLKDDDNETEPLLVDNESRDIP